MISPSEYCVLIQPFSLKLVHVFDLKLGRQQLLWLISILDIWMCWRWVECLNSDCYTHCRGEIRVKLCWVFVVWLAIQASYGFKVIWGWIGFFWSWIGGSPWCMIFAIAHCQNMLHVGAWPFLGQHLVTNFNLKYSSPWLHAHMLLTSEVDFQITISKFGYAMAFCYALLRIA